MNMTREQKLARANEIFNHVWGEPAARNDVLNEIETLASDLDGWITELADHVDPEKDKWFTLEELVEKFSEACNRLERIELNQQKETA